MKTVVHLTSAHARYDTRIFLKMCCSLAEVSDYKVSLVVADGLGNEIKNSVYIYDVGTKFQNRFSRMVLTVNKVFEKAISLNADIYHLHDPELMPIGYKLKKLGKKVIFDAHEDLPNQILSKHYLSPLMRKILSFTAKHTESYYCKFFDGVIVAAEPSIKDKFLKINSNTVVINNYPILEEFVKLPIDKKIPNQVCYVGGLARTRGIVEIIQAIAMTKNPCKLILAGDFSDIELEKEVKGLSGWKNVEFLGYIEREGVKNLYKQSSIGLVTLHPTPSYLNSMPIKMFEYMCSDLAVVASDFELWQPIIMDNGCGIQVNPLSPQEIANALDELIENAEATKKMGEKGREIAVKSYNWLGEQRTLLNFYQDLLNH